MDRNDQAFIVQKIRTQYTEKEDTQLDKLKQLDKQVKRPANAFAYTFGIVGSLVLGSGMSLAMKVIGNAMIPGIAIGVVGIGMVCSNYPIYKKILASRRKKYADEIIKLSEEIMKG